MLSLELHATPQEVMRAVEALEEFCLVQQVPKKDIFGLTLALEECGSNIVNHALNRDGQQTFRVTVERRADQIIIELRDKGPEFDPTRREEKAAADQDLPGGWGVQLVRRYTDEFRYSRESGHNVLRLVKRLASEAAGD